MTSARKESPRLWPASPTQNAELQLDTEIAANECLKAHQSGRFFSLEHPKNSIARRLDSWQRLEREPGVMRSEYHACMFEGGRRRKAQVLLHNVKPLKVRRKCTRTGQSHLPWRPRVVNGRVTSFATGLEREYPLGFAGSLPKVRRILAQRLVRSSKSFRAPKHRFQGNCASCGTWSNPP